MTKPDWKKIVGSVAPTVAAVLGGPLAGVAVRTLATQLLNKPDADECEVESALLAATPETLVKLKQVEFDFKKTLVDAGIKLEEIAAQDRANARDREIKTGDVWTPRWIASIVILGWFLIQWYLLEHVIDKDMREIIMRTLGTLDMALGLVLGYYFGSSSSSKHKDETISRISKGGAVS